MINIYNHLITHQLLLEKKINKTIKFKVCIIDNKNIKILNLIIILSNVISFSIILNDENLRQAYQSETFAREKNKPNEKNRGL